MGVALNPHLGYIYYKQTNNCNQWHQHEPKGELKSYFFARLLVFRLLECMLAYQVCSCFIACFVHVCREGSSPCWENPRYAICSWINLPLCKSAEPIFCSADFGLTLPHCFRYCYLLTTATPQKGHGACGCWHQRLTRKRLAQEREPQSLSLL